jgi:type III secretory pathway component EscS
MLPTLGDLLQMAMMAMMTMMALAPWHHGRQLINFSSQRFLKVQMAWKTA